MWDEDTPEQRENLQRLKEFDRKYGSPCGFVCGLFVIILVFFNIEHNEPECEMGTRYLEEDYPYCSQDVYRGKIKGYKYHIHNSIAPYPWNLCESALARHHRGLIYNGRMVSDFNHQYARDNWEIVPIDYEFEQKQYQIQQEEEYERNEEYAQKEFERRYELYMSKKAEEFTIEKIEEMSKNTFCETGVCPEDEWNLEKAYEKWKAKSDEYYSQFDCLNGGCTYETIKSEPIPEECEADYPGEQCKSILNFIGGKFKGRGISEPSERVVDSRTSRQLEWEKYINSKAGEDGLDIAEFDKALEEWNAKLVYPYTKEGENGLGTIEMPFYNEQMDLPKEALSPVFKGYRIDPPKDEVYSTPATASSFTDDFLNEVHKLPNNVWTKMTKEQIDEFNKKLPKINPTKDEVLVDCADCCEQERQRIAKAFEEWQCADGCHKVPNDKALFGNFDCVCPKIEAFNPNREKTPDNIKEFMEESTTVFGKMEKLNDELLEEVKDMVDTWEEYRKKYDL